MKQLIKEYHITLRRINRAKTEATNTEDKSLLASCSDSLSFSIKYMEMGKHPDNRRGITRRSSLQREIPVDPQDEAFVRAAALQRQPSEVSDRIQSAIKDLKIAMRDLTMKEKEAYALVRADGYSFGEVAWIMGIQKSTVQTLVKRAEEKIGDMVEDLTDRGIVFKQDIQLEMF